MSTAQNRFLGSVVVAAFALLAAYGDGTGGQNPADNLMDVLKKAAGRGIALTKEQREAEKKACEELIGKRVRGTLTRYSTTQAKQEFKVGNRSIKVGALSSYRISDPVLASAKRGQPVHFEGIVVQALQVGAHSGVRLDLGPDAVILAGCTFGTDAERKAAGSGAIKDLEKQRVLARDLIRSVGAQRGDGVPLDKVRGRIALEDLLLNCPDAPEANQARTILKQLDVISANAQKQLEKNAKPLHLAGLIARELAWKDEARTAAKTRNQNQMTKVRIAHDEERKSWHGRTAKGTAQVEVVNGNSIVLVAAPRTRGIRGTVKDPSDPVLSFLKRGDMVEVEGIIETGPGAASFSLKDCVVKKR